MKMVNRLIGIYSVLVVALCGCDSKSVTTGTMAENEDPAQAADSTVATSVPEVVFEFVGQWEGRYGCKTLGVDPAADVLVIALGEVGGEYRVTLHAGAENPSVVIGTARGSDAIVIAQQNIAGMAGTAEILADGEGISLTQRGLGITCEGTYRRAVR